jgi:hypothetical protein
MEFHPTSLSPPEQLIAHTLRYGFNNVIDAFHVIGRDPIPRRFFIDERLGNNGIRITDEFSELLSGYQADNLPGEAEARWRLVERAWSLGLSRNLLSVSYDSATETLFTFDSQYRRKSVTGSRGASIAFPTRQNKVPNPINSWSDNVRLQFMWEKMVHVGTIDPI